MHIQVADRRNYKNGVDAMVRMLREEVIHAWPERDVCQGSFFLIPGLKGFLFRRRPNPRPVS